MTEEKLMFEAGAAAAQITALLGRTCGRGREPRRRLTPLEAIELAALGRSLNCATTELLNQERGVGESKIG